MRAREVFAFIQGMFEDGTLPEGRNLWGYAYNIDRYPAALRAAARHGMSEYHFQEWMMEYARRSKTTPPLMLPVEVRWGENERPERTLVHVPLYTMKDFDSLPSATEAALKLEANTDAGEEVYMRDMRAPDVPDVWARVVVDGEEKTVQFNPLKMWRGEVKLRRGGCDLKQVRVLEWRVVGAEYSPLDTTFGQNLHDVEQQKATEATVYTNSQTEQPNFQTKQNQNQSTWIDRLPKWMQRCLIAVGVLGVGFFVYQETTRPEPVVLPQAGELVKICQDGATGWSDIGWLRTHDGEAQTDKRAAARTRKEARGRGMLVELPGGSRHTVEVVMKKPLETSEGPVYYVGLAGEDGRVFIRHTELAK